MGIKNLNKFLKEECKNSIKCISLSELSGKKIAIDISIYLYKYTAEDTLIENIYLMISIFRYYNIIPIFVFDGKPPAEKKELLKKRLQDKYTAEKEYNKLKEQLYNKEIDESEKQDLIENMDSLKKQFIYIKQDQIQRVKELIRLYGVTYYDAPGEADELCGLLVIKKKVWACLSEDMDMFVYGCNRVLRYFSLLNHTMVCYDMKGILNELGVTQKEFREICVLSGTDYNNNKSDLYQTLKHFKKYYKIKKDYKGDFYGWLNENTNYIEDYYSLVKIYDMFDLHNSKENIKIFEKIKIMNGPVYMDEIKNILETYSCFIF